MPKQQRDEIVLQATRVTGVKDVKGERLLKGRHISVDEFEALLAACRSDPSPAGRRDAALFAIGWSTGLRRSELAALSLHDLTMVGRQWKVAVRGKGNKTRNIYLSKDAQPWVKAWLLAAGHNGGPLFCRIRKGGKLVHGHSLTDEALAQILDRRSKEAALPERLAWHDFRRTFAGNLLDNGVDLATVQRLLGHSSPTTTSNYDRRGEAAKQRAADVIQLPLQPDE